MRETAQIPCLKGISGRGAAPDSWLSRCFRGFFSSQETRIPSSCRYGNEFAHAHEVKRGECEGENHINASQSANFDFTDSTDHFLPAEDFLDPLALALTHFVSFVTCRPLIDSATSVRLVLRNVRRHTERTQVRYEVGCVISLISSQGNATRPADAPDHLQSRFSLGGSRGQRQAPVHDQTVPVLHE